MKLEDAIEKSPSGDVTRLAWCEYDDVQVTEVGDQVPRVIPVIQKIKQKVSAIEHTFSPEDLELDDWMPC